MSLMEMLKQKQRDEAAELAKKVTREPNLDEVITIWGAYAEKLKVDLKHSAVTSFNLAKIRVEGLRVIATSVTSINQKFLEIEATNLLENFKNHFFNMDIKFEMEVVEEVNEAPKEIAAKFLSGQDRYKLMATDYPMVRLLRDKLRLEISY